MNDVRLHRAPLTHNPRVVSLEELNRIRYGTAHGVIASAARPQDGAAKEHGGSPPMNAVKDDEPPPSEPGRKKKRHTFTPEQRLQILAELSQPGANEAAIRQKHGVHQVTVWGWKKKLEDKPRQSRGFKPAKRRRVAPERGLRPERPELFTEPAKRSKGPGRFAGIAEVRAALARLIEDAQTAARGVEQLQMELDRMRSIFGGE